MAALSVGTTKEAARACTLSASCRSVRRSLRSPYLTTSQVHLSKGARHCVAQHCAQRTQWHGIKKALRGVRVEVAHRIIDWRNQECEGVLQRNLQAATTLQFSPLPASYRAETQLSSNGGASK
ncbi:hypothetical protein TRIUR3_18442 [Triticum urartu]|uniref:Uncharacterized protein n=1 Tax=Triticum urartu TaxID=4572 RepID=M7Z449_TRIUA|nr:hypothetical protein TRIUR3_18442 [Triticum urartu]